MQETGTENPMLQMEHQTILRIYSLLPPLTCVTKTKWLRGSLVHLHRQDRWIGKWFGGLIDECMDGG